MTPEERTAKPVETKAVIAGIEAMEHGLVSVRCDVVVVVPCNHAEKGVPHLVAFTDDGRDVARAFFECDVSLYLIVPGAGLALNPGRKPVWSVSDSGVVVTDGEDTVTLTRGGRRSQYVTVHRLPGEVTWRKIKRRMDWVPGQTRL